MAQPRLPAIKKFVSHRLFHNNDNNICQLAPYWLREGTDNVLEVKNEFFKYWTQNDTVELLTAAGFNCIGVDQLSGGFPPDTFNSDLPEWYWKVYQIISNRADASRWYHILPDTVLGTAEQLLSMNLVPPDDGWFVKTSRCSTKHDFLPTPVFSVQQAIDQLRSSPKASKALSQGASIMLRPWLKEINKECEVRVFVREGIVVGVSQQFCYSVLSFLSMLDADEVINAAQQCYDDIASKLPQKHGFQDECTFDAYIKPDGKIAPVEINGGGFGNGPPGASLFSWTHRPPPAINEPPMFLIAE